MKKQENNNPNAQCMNCPGVELYVRGSVKIGKMRKYFCNFAVLIDEKDGGGGFLDIAVDGPIQRCYLRTV